VTRPEPVPLAGMLRDFMKTYLQNMARDTIGEGKLDKELEQRFNDKVAEFDIE
jgi:hypothetical protein